MNDIDSTLREVAPIIAAQRIQNQLRDAARKVTLATGNQPMTDRRRKYLAEAYMLVELAQRELYTLLVSAFPAIEESQDD